MVVIKKNSNFMVKTRVPLGNRLGNGEGLLKLTRDTKTYFENGTRVNINNMTFVMGPIVRNNNCGCNDLHCCHMNEAQNEPETPYSTSLAPFTQYSVNEDIVGLPQALKLETEVVFERGTHIELEEGTHLHSPDGTLELILAKPTNATLF
jgi:hypothetical protein